MTKQADDFLTLTDALRCSLAGDEAGPDLTGSAERIVAAGLLPEFGRAALTLLLQHRLAHLRTRQALVWAALPKPPMH